MTSPSQPANRRLQEISHLFLSSSSPARSTPPSTQIVTAASEPRRSLTPPRVLAVGSATDPLVTGFITCRLALRFRAKGRRVLLFDAAGQPWFVKRFLGVEGEADPGGEIPSPTLLRESGLAWYSPPEGPAATWEPAANPSSPADRLVAAEREADLLLILLPCHSLAGYLQRFFSPWQEFLIATSSAREEVGRTFSRIREIHRRHPYARLGLVPVGAIERQEAESCFRRLARAARELLEVELRSYGYLSAAPDLLRCLGGGEGLDMRTLEGLDAQIDATTSLLLEDGRPTATGSPTTGGFFFDVLVRNAG